MGIYGYLWVMGLNPPVLCDWPPSNCRPTRWKEPSCRWQIMLGTPVDVYSSLAAYLAHCPWFPMFLKPDVRFDWATRVQSSRFTEGSASSLRGFFRGFHCVFPFFYTSCIHRWIATCCSEGQQFAIVCPLEMSATQCPEMPRGLLCCASQSLSPCGKVVERHDSPGGTSPAVSLPACPQIEESLIILPRFPKKNYMIYSTWQRIGETCTLW
jgi:hypothetical protein